MNFSVDNSIINIKSIKPDKELKAYSATIIKWLFISVTVGIICGAVGAVFHHILDLGSEINRTSIFMVFLLPLCGLAITFIYKTLKLYPDPGTNAVLKSSLKGEAVSEKMSIAIFISTFLTQLSGGSAGREGAALQLGGSLAGFIGKKLKLSPVQMRAIILCGMASLFSALFGTPVTACIFCLEVVYIGSIPYGALAPCLMSSFVAFGVSKSLGMVPTAFKIALWPKADIGLFIRLCILALLCAAVSKLFCEIQHLSKHLFDRIKNPYLRILIGSGVLIAFTFLIGSQRYNGAGMAAVNDAILLGKATYLSFLIKTVFTAVTLGSGFKGGEIVPCFFVGSTFGAAFGALLGIDPRFAAAVGMICVFCGVVNSPFASIALAVEAFGGSMLTLIALPVGICYLLSGSCSLYSTQILPRNKISIEIKENNEV